jgi:dTDP-4-amino-4,6-dideoxygalactose transaminase
MLIPTLAMLGGTPVRTGGWPAWPPDDSAARAALCAAFASGRWTITSPGRGEPAWEPRLGSAFAAFCGTTFGVPTTSGSSALTVSLAAAGVRAGDEVIVPVITWVACAASDLALGAVPVPVEVDPDDLCMSPASAQAAISPRTSAILVVHQNCSVADVTALSKVATDAGLALIEDCSHAHGARSGGRRVGTFGAVGAFSLQQNKLLACGEGGIAVTADPDTYRRLQQLRCNGREYAHPTTHDGELVEVGDEMGDNYVLAEMPAAVALARLASLDAENARRRAAAAYLHEGFAGIEGVRPVTTVRPGDEPTYHKYTVVVDSEAFASVPVTTLARALTAEVGFAIGVLDDPLIANPLYRPERSARLAAREPARHPAEYPHAMAAARSCLTIRHHALLANRPLLDDLLEGLAKVQREAASLAG